MRQTVEGTFEGEESVAASRCAREFERTLDGLGPGVTKEDGVEVRRQSLEQRFGKKSAQERTVHLHHVGEVEL